MKFYLNALWADIFLRIMNEAPAMAFIFSPFLKTPSTLLQRVLEGAFETGTPDISGCLFNSGLVRGPQHESIKEPFLMCGT